jgi:hypothetical protein
MSARLPRWRMASAAACSCILALSSALDLAQVAGIYLLPKLPHPVCHLRLVHLAIVSQDAYAFPHRVKKVIDCHVNNDK